MMALDLTEETVRTDRLVLRPLSSDVDVVHRASQDSETQRWIGALPVPYTREDARRFVEDVSVQERADGLALPCAIEADGDLADWALGLGAPRVHLYADVGNTASQAVARRAGFTQEGVARSCLEYRDGTRGDAVLFGRMR